MSQPEDRVNVRCFTDGSRNFVAMEATDFHRWQGWYGEMAAKLRALETVNTELVKSNHKLGFHALDAKAELLAIERKLDDARNERDEARNQVAAIRAALGGAR